MFDRVEATVSASGFRGCRASSVGLSAAHLAQVVVRRHEQRSASRAEGHLRVAGMTEFRTLAAGRGAA